MSLTTFAMGKLNPIGAAISPYMLWIKLGAVAAVLLFAFSSGCTVQKWHDAKKFDGVQAQLTAANVSLTAAGQALDQVNAEAQRQIKAAEANAKAAKQAEGVAHLAEADMAKKADQFEVRLKKARANLTCDALLKRDLAKECNL